MSIKLNERYPGRMNNPSSDYPQGSFKNRTALSAKDGSYLEKDWANDKEGFFQSLLSVAEITANGAVDKVGASQFFDALQQLKQNQSGVAFTTTGPSAALVLTPTPAITAYTAGQRFRVKFSRASTGTDTVNISGIGPKLLKQYDSAGAKVAAVFAANQLADVEYDGTDVVLLNPLPSANQSRQGVRGAALKWKASADGLSPSIAYSADMVTVCNAAGDAVTLLNLSGNLSTSATASATVNGMASGATAVSTIYGIYVWYNPTTAAVVVTGDSSLTAPTAPAAGFTHWARRGTFRTDSNASNKYPFAFIAYGNKTQLDPAAGRNITDAYQLTTTGGTLAISAVSLSAIVPSTAISVRLTTRVSATGASVAISIAPRADSSNLAGGFVVPSGAVGNSISEMLIISSTIYWAVAITSSGTATLYCMGWEDAL